MKRSATIAATIDEYIAGHPPAIRQRLSAMRSTIRKHAPDAEERISYRIPTFYLDGNLVHFAAFDRHVGFYPGAAGIAAFQTALAGYKSAKGSVQFPHDEPLPLELVAEIVRFRVAQQAPELTGGARCRVVAGTHAGKSGVVRDIHTSKGGHVTITVVQDNGVRFKTLAKNVVVATRD